MKNKYGFSTFYNFVDSIKLEHYSNLIQWLVRLTNCKKYLEIGVSSGDNIINIKNKVDLCEGVDMYDIISDKEDIKFNLMDSDSFFQNNSNIYDIIFIDGNHDFLQVKKDFENSLKVLNKYGIIILHDTDPVEEFLTQSHYCSDSYKIIDYIYVNHPELNVITLPIHETGLSLVMRRSDRRIYDFI